MVLTSVPPKGVVTSAATSASGDEGVEVWKVRFGLDHSHHISSLTLLHRGLRLFEGGTVSPLLGAPPVEAALHQRLQKGGGGGVTQVWERRLAYIVNRTPHQVSNYSNSTHYAMQLHNT